jgi:hypothetical protein
MVADGDDKHDIDDWKSIQSPAGIAKRMRWFRANMRLGAWCAVLALAVQFAVSLGHLHRGDSPAPFGSLLQSVLLDDSHTAALPDDPTAPGKSTAPTMDYCAICAVANLAASAVPAAAPGLPLPLVTGPARFWPNIVAATAASPHSLFQARAPPRA